MLKHRRVSVPLNASAVVLSVVVVVVVVFQRRRGHPSFPFFLSLPLSSPHRLLFLSAR